MLEIFHIVSYYSQTLCLIGFCSILHCPIKESATFQNPWAFVMFYAVSGCFWLWGIDPNDSSFQVQRLQLPHQRSAQTFWNSGIWVGLLDIHFLLLPLAFCTVGILDGISMVFLVMHISSKTSDDEPSGFGLEGALPTYFAGDFAGESSRCLRLPALLLPACPIAFCRSLESQRCFWCRV